MAGLAKSGHFLPTEEAILTDGFLFYANSPVWAYRPAQASRSGRLNVKTRVSTQLSAIAATVIFASLAAAADGAGKDDAIAMVKKATTFIKEQGPDKAYPEISNKAGKFIDRDLYVVVYQLDGKVLAHGSNEKFVGKDMIDAQDVDGKLYVKERVELAAKQPSFWQDYKFVNPVSKKVEPKQMYCEKLDNTAVCAGIYKL
jgi:signal transduction histidine kinase